MELIRKVLNMIFVYFNYGKYLKTQFYNREALENLQLQKLKKIVSIAIDKVPYYKKYKDQIDLNNFSLEDLKIFPIIDKAVIQKNLGGFIREDVSIDKIHWKATSGSSGKPFQVAKPFYSDGLEMLLGHRAWSMGKFVYRVREKAIVLRSFSPKENEPVWKRDKIRNFWYLSPYHINQEHLKEFIQVFKKSNAKILKGYPSSIYILTLLLKENKIRIPQIRTIITSSETMLPQYRRVIHDYWQCDVLDWYGQNERTVTIQQCDEGNYHNNDEYGMCELSEDNDLIATSLTNTIMPLIRYNTHDKVNPYIGTQKCRCGRGLSIPFKQIEGRSDDIIYKHDKTPIPTINFYSLMERFQKVKQFHLIQNEDLSIEMVVSEQEKMDENDLKDLKNGIRQRVGELPIVVHVVDEVKRNSQTDKVKIIESKVNL